MVRTRLIFMFNNWHHAAVFGNVVHFREESMEKVSLSPQKLKSDSVRTEKETLILKQLMCA